MINRELPNSFESEQAVLGSMLISSKAITVAKDSLTPTDFYNPHNRLVYQAMCHLDARSEPVDITTIADVMQSKGVLERVGGRPYIAGLMDAVATAEHVGYHIAAVRQKAILRNLIRIGTELVDECHGDPGDAEDLASRRALEIHQAIGAGTTDPLLSIQDAFDEAMARYEYLAAHPNECAGIRTGLTDLDDYTKGLQRGDFNVIAGRPGMGKSCLGMTIYRNMLHAGKRCVYFSLEMTRDQNLNRIIQAEASVEGWRLREPKNLEQRHWESLRAARERVADAMAWLDCEARTPDRIRDRCRRVAGEAGLDAVFVDHFHLVRWPGRSDGEVDQLNRISDALTDLAKELNVVLVCMAQLNRDVEKRRERRPCLADLKGCGKLEENAAFVGMLFRQSYYDQQDAHENGGHFEPEDEDAAELIIPKARHDGANSISLTFNGRYARFISYTGGA